MRKTLLMLLMIAGKLITPVQAQIQVIPEPVSITQQKGTFVVPNTITIFQNNAQLQPIEDFLKIKFSAHNRRFVQTREKAKANIVILLNEKQDTLLKQEGYRLDVAKKGIKITANTSQGAFYGLQTLFQLLPPEIESKESVKNSPMSVPLVSIVDYPQVKWRGLMLDVARHFFTVKEVKQYIDAMLKYKYNLLHLHLTDDEGWRLEIKSLPKLTEIGAWRAERIGTFGTFTKSSPDEPKTYGGFYTQEDIKEIIRYAKEKYIDILPEIDMPAHSLAALASYPELSGTEGTYNVSSGEPFMDWSHGAPPIAFIDNTLGPANEKVYDFVDQVMTEVAQLFPFEYIHVGGDEAPHNFWEKNEQIKALMQREGLTTIPQVQAYFEKRVEKIVQSKGKKMMAWDEVLEGGISPSTAIGNWRKIEYGQKASQSGHFVVMCPTTYAYLDYMQGDVSTEPKVYSSLRLNKAYEFNPIQEGVNPNFILGGQANLWTEQIYNIRQAEYMTWPRAMAIAECLWTPLKSKNWEKFVAKTETHFKRMDCAETKYSKAVYDPIIDVNKKDDAYYVTLSTEISGLDIHYSFDNSEPDSFYPIYKEALLIPNDAERLKLITYKGKEAKGRMMTILVEDLKKRVKVIPKPAS